MNDLTKQELTVLELIAKGMPNKAISYKLKISDATVKVHVKSIMEKLNVANRTQAALWVCDNMPKLRGKEIESVPLTDIQAAIGRVNTAMQELQSLLV